MYALSQPLSVSHPQASNDPSSHRPPQNAASLAQLPFLGKKTVPARLRKDLWTPLCLVEFPRSSQGLLAYRRLREFRRLHETSYPLSLITKNMHTGTLHSKKKRGKILMDQKANSVADLAAVLALQEEGSSEEHMEEVRRKAERVRVQKERGKKAWRSKEPEGPVGPGVACVQVRWVNLLDSEFAEQWPERVEHGELTKHRYTAALPLMEENGEATQGGEKKFEVPAALLEQGGKAGREVRA
ncbi:MAG: hypothetical protein Q9170_003196 [Blastenia crenularia]